jgi:SAM-dependent methyltransferase
MAEKNMKHDGVREEGDTGKPRGRTFQPDIYPKVLSLLPAGEDVTLLDAGAGEGYFSRVAADHGFRVEACDYQKSLFKPDDIPFHQADLNEAIPLPDESFDCVVSIEVIEHVENHARFVNELLRVTRVGGTLIVTTPNVLSLSSRWHFFLYGYTDCAPLPLDPELDDYSMQHINPISLPELLFQFERFGGELVQLTTNRIRRGSRFSALLFYPMLSLALRRRLLRKKYSKYRQLYRRHLEWMLHPANLKGRITIAVVRRVS